MCIFFGPRKVCRDHCRLNYTDDRCQLIKSENVERKTNVYFICESISNIPVDCFCVFFFITLTLFWFLTQATNIFTHLLVFTSFFFGHFIDARSRRTVFAVNHVFHVFKMNKKDNAQCIRNFSMNLFSWPLLFGLNKGMS